MADERYGSDMLKEENIDIEAEVDTDTDTEVVAEDVNGDAVESDAVESDVVNNEVVDVADGEEVANNEDVDVDVAEATQSEQGGKGYIHVSCIEDGDSVCKDIEAYGFTCNILGSDADITTLYHSIHGACEVVIIEPSAGYIDGGNEMAYQVREALVCGIEPVIICRREISELGRKFENEPRVTVIKGTSPSGLLHLLYVEKLCRHGELFSRDTCRRDELGDIIRQAVDAWQGNAASERCIAQRYMQGDGLPVLYKQGVFWYLRAVEHGSIRSIVGLGDCYFYGKGSPENKKKGYEKYCEAVERGSAEGNLRRGVCLLEGAGCEADCEEAYNCFKTALKIKKGYAEAEYYVGVCLWRGLGAEVSVADAKGHLLRAAKGNYIPALIMLGDIFSQRCSDDHNPALSFEYYSRAAQQGSVEGLYKKGLALASGDGCPRDSVAAYECFLEGAKAKDPACLCSLGMCYEFGEGCECDYSRAFEYYTQAAERGYPAAINNLGGCYFYGHGVIRDRARAIELFERASAKGDRNAMARLGICYESGIECERDTRRAFGYYSDAAASGNSIAAYKAAMCCESGIGVEKSFSRAFYYYERAANLGHPDAMKRVADCLADGIGVDKDYWAAYKWYTKGAEAKVAECFLQMAHFSFKGIGTAKNYANAYHCYVKANELGADPEETALRIGICNLRGLGTQKNYSKALGWFKQASAHGSANGMFLCGECYMYGAGCERDTERAVKYYASAANAGHARAAVALGDCYVNGTGVKQSMAQALSLYKRAMTHDSAEAYYKAACVQDEMGADMGNAVLPNLFRSANKGYIPAVLFLGKLYDAGRGVPQNSEKAAEKYLKAISLGIEKRKILLFSLPERNKDEADIMHSASVDATYRLGMLKGRHARGVEEYTQAFEYLAGAAATGSHDAQAEVVRIYAEGGDLQNYFRSEVHSGDPDPVAIANAMNKLGDAWYEGKPLISKNDRAAVKCYRVAAQMGQNDAAYSLGWCLRHGVGGKVDDAEAARWLKLAADNGNPHAAYSYGLCCEEGSGMDHPNIREAATYYRKAAAAGHIEAKKRHLKMMDK